MAYFEDILARSAQLGGEVDKPLQPARSWLAKADALNKQLGAARAAEEAEFAKAIEATAASGKLPAPNGFHWAFDSPASKMVVTSVSLCHQNAATAGRAAGPKIFEALQARIAAVVDESVSLTKALPDLVTDERTAARAGADCYAAWQRLQALLNDWESAHELNRTMQRARWVDGPDSVHDRPGVRPFEAYEKPPPLVVIPRVARERHLAAAVAAGAGPALIDWPTAVGRFERIDRRQRHYSSMEVRQAHDALGNVTAESRSPERPSEYVSAGRAG